MHPIQIIVLALGFAAMILAFIGIRRTRPCMWDTYVAKGVPLARVQLTFKAFQVLFILIGLLNGTLIAVFFLIP